MSKGKRLPTKIIITQTRARLIQYRLSHWSFNLIPQTFFTSLVWFCMEDWYIKRSADQVGRSFANQLPGWKRLCCSWRRCASLMPYSCYPAPPISHIWSSRRASMSYSGTSTNRPSIIRSFTRKRDPSASRIIFLYLKTRYTDHISTYTDEQYIKESNYFFLYKIF